MKHAPFILLLLMPLSALAQSGGIEGEVKTGLLAIKAVDESVRTDKCLYIGLNMKYLLKPDGVQPFVFGGFDSYGISQGLRGQSPFRIVYTLGIGIAYKSADVSWTHFCSHPVESGFSGDFMKVNSIFGEHDAFVLTLRF